MNLPIAKLSARRKTWLRNGLRNALEFQSMILDLSDSEGAQQAELEFLLEQELKREKPRRSILKRVHGKLSSLRSRREWAYVESHIHVGS